MSVDLLVELGLADLLAGGQDLALVVVLDGEWAVAPGLVLAEDSLVTVVLDWAWEFHETLAKSEQTALA